MIRQDLSSRDLAETLHMSPSNISKKMNGKAEWVVWEVKKLMETFFSGMSISFLFYE
jgi:DNA-binding Xre family transcriptional regulator